MQYNILTGRTTDSAQKEEIAKGYRGSNELGARDIFEAKKQYNDTVLSLLPSDVSTRSIHAIFNDTYLPLYGTVNRNVIPLQPKKEYLSFYLEGENAFSGLDFVINSFINFRKAYQRGIYEGRASTVGTTLGNIEVVKARDDGQKAVQLHIQTIVDNFISFCIADVVNRKKIITPENFVYYFSNFLLYYSKLNIVNYSTFLLTGEVDINFNGLCLDLLEVPYDVDSQKVSQVYLDPNFLYFLDAADSFGFLISKEYPSKLIANLNSQKMRDNICACGGRYLNGLVLNTADEIVDFYYEPSYVYDLGTLRNIFSIAYTTFYNRFSTENLDTYSDFRIKSRKLYRTASQNDLVLQLLDDKFLISLYIRMKNSEMKINYSDGSIDRFDRTSKTIYDRYGVDESMKYINEKLRLALEPFMPDKKNFVNTENFSIEEALGLIRLSRYDY